VVPGDTTWIANGQIAKNNIDVGLHELLHNFNLGHANDADNNEYKDYSCIMSNYPLQAGQVRL
jgi:hypothetical protein